MTGALAIKPIPSKCEIEDKFSEQRQNYLSLYRSRTRYIRKKTGDEEWGTVKGPLFTALIDAAISGKCDTFYGAYWGPQTQYAVLDIDASSQYHDREKLTELLAAVENVGLKANVYQSSDSGGWHLYIPLADWQKSCEVEHTFKRWLKALGYEIKGGQLEVFPSGCALRLPLQAGFAWLAPDTSVIRKREDITVNEALAYFVEDQKVNAQNWQLAKSRMESQISAADRAAGREDQAHQERLETSGFEPLWTSRQTSRQISKTSEQARRYWQEGLTGNKQRHEALYAIQHLLWYGDQTLGIPRLPGTQNDERRQQLLREWLEKKHNGFCRHVNQGQWREIDESIRRSCEWRGNHRRLFERTPYLNTEVLQDVCIRVTKRTGYLFKPEDAQRANEKREEEARDRIRTAVEILTSQGQQVTVRALMRVGRCCNKTLQKHSDIWMSSSVRFLASVGGDLDPGGSGGLALVASSEFEEEKKVFEIESSSGVGCVLDSLRYDRTGQTATNSRQVTPKVLAAVHPIQSNSGVKHELAGCAPCVASGGIACGINGFLPTATQRVPSIYSSAFFSMGAPAQNLRQLGNRCDGLTYNLDILSNSGTGLNVIAQAWQVDNCISPFLSLERAFGYVPLSCYDKRRLRAGGRLLSPNGYIALGSEAHAMGNESHEKPEQERPAERQTEHVKHAQGEVTNAAESYTEQVKVHRIEKKLSGNSGATGQLPDENGKGLASAKDLLGDDAHGLSKKEKQAALLAQIERDGYIVGRRADDDELLAQAPKDDPLTKLKNKFEHPGRNDPDSCVDYASASDAYQRFGFDKYGIDKDLLGGVLRNEQYWLNATDVAQDYYSVHRPFMLPTQHSWSVGPGQVQIRIMEDLVSKYAEKLPEFKPAKQVMTVGGMDVAERPADVAMLAQNKKNAALIVGAYFAEVIDKLEKGQPPCGYGTTDAENQTIIRLWQKGTTEARNEALIRSFNPREGSTHVQNVLKHMAEIKKHQPG